ncbi:MAG TPA: thioredoxin fold domain-containing protein [Candidatus Kapabacteria bacterium]|nr:thioredoxin fold domain-containing protein [Candidatus Kapabacteria bacterium]
MRTILLSFLALCLGVSMASSVRAEVHFKDLSFAEAKKLAGKEHKQVMVDFYTTWCSWCKVLDRKTYTDEHVTQITDAKFISVKIDAEKGEGIALAKQYQVNGYPTVVFFSPTGKEIDRVVGYEDADKFARSLNVAAEGGAKAVLDEVGKKKGSTDPNKWMIAGNYYAEHGDKTKAIDAFNKVMQLDQVDKLKLKEEALYDVGFLSDGDTKWMLLQQAIDEYPNRDEGSEAVMMMLQHDFEANRPQEAGHLIDHWAMLHPQDGNTFNYFAWTAAEKGVLLDQAEQYASRAIATMQAPTDRAGAMDTRAEVLFKTGRATEASQVEQEAISMLDASKDAKLYKQLTAQKAKFDAGTSGGQAGLPGGTAVAH